MAALIWLLRDHSVLILLFYYATGLLFNVLLRLGLLSTLELPLVEKNGM